jgi:hypothetical protein
MTSSASCFPVKKSGDGMKNATVPSAPLRTGGDRRYIKGCDGYFGAD